MIGKAIYSILSNDADVSGLTTRIYPMQAPQDTANPCIIYNLNSRPEDDKGGKASIFYIDVQVDVYTDDGAGGYEDNATLSDHVINALDRYAGTVQGHKIDTIILRDRTDFFDPVAQNYRTMIDFRVRLAITDTAIFQDGNTIIYQDGNVMIYN